MLCVSQPREDASSQTEQMLVANVETGGWARYTGWDAHSICYFDGYGYFGTKGGEIFQMEVGGYDDDQPYTAILVGQFSHFGKPGLDKTYLQSRAIFRANGPLVYKVSGSVDYSIDVPDAPPAVSGFTSAVWDTAKWDVDVWDGGDLTTYSAVTYWRSIGREGYSYAPVIQITQGQDVAVSVEFLAAITTYRENGLVV